MEICTVIFHGVEQITNYEIAGNGFYSALELALLPKYPFLFSIFRCLLHNVTKQLLHLNFVPQTAIARIHIQFITKIKLSNSLGKEQPQCNSALEKETLQID